MAEADVAHQPVDVALLKHVLHQPVVLTQMQAITVPGGHAGGVLAAVLQDDQGIVNALVDRPPTD